MQLPHTDPDGWCRQWRPDRRQLTPVSPRTTSIPTAWYRRASRAAQTCTRVQDARHPADHGAVGAPHLCNCRCRQWRPDRRQLNPNMARLLHPSAAWCREQFRPASVCKTYPTKTDGIAEASRQSITQLDLVHEQPALHSRQVVVERTDIVRKRACPSPSEVHAGNVRRRAYPSSSGELLDIVRRKGVCQSFLLRGTQRQRRGTHRRCEEEGGRAIPLPPMKS